MDKIVREIICEVFPISELTFQPLSDLLTFESYKKGDVFIQRGKRNEKEYFVLTGVCKSFLLNPKGNETTISFFTDKSILSPYQSRTSGGLSQLNFKALTDLELASIPAKSFESLMIKNIEVRNFGNTVLQNELMSKVEKEIGLATQTAKERLIDFRRRYKMLENMIPHPDIASYLGITNISLSRLRKELMD